MTEMVARIEAQSDRRRAPRAALRLSATMREPGRSRVGVRVIDISTHGCRIEVSSTACIGSWVWLSIAGLETQYCRIVWNCQEFAGLEFATPLAEAVLERLLEDKGALSERTIVELRDIASRTRALAGKQKDADTEILAELSRKCTLEAVIGGLRLGDSGRNKDGAPKRPR